MKWWLIENETIETVKLALREAHRCLGSPITQIWSDALHSLDSGLHQTDAVPGDWVRPDEEGGAG